MGEKEMTIDEMIVYSEKHPQETSLYLFALRKRFPNKVMMLEKILLMNSFSYRQFRYRRMVDMVVSQMLSIFDMTGLNYKSGEASDVKIFIPRSVMSNTSIEGRPYVLLVFQEAEAYKHALDQIEKYIALSKTANNVDLEIMCLFHETLKICIIEPETTRACIKNSAYMNTAEIARTFWNADFPPVSMLKWFDELRKS